MAPSEPDVPSVRMSRGQVVSEGSAYRGDSVGSVAGRGCEAPRSAGMTESEFRRTGVSAAQPDCEHYQEQTGEQKNKPGDPRLRERMTRMAVAQVVQQRQQDRIRDSQCNLRLVEYEGQHRRMLQPRRANWARGWRSCA